MKVKNEKSFTPITLEITIENEQELLELYHRLNAAATNIKDGSDYSQVPYPFSWGHISELYDAVEKLV